MVAISHVLVLVLCGLFIVGVNTAPTKPGEIKSKSTIEKEGTDSQGVDAAKRKEMDDMAYRLRDDPDFQEMNAKERDEFLQLASNCGHQ
jgi:hypothetical protein